MWNEWRPLILFYYCHIFFKKKNHSFVSLYYNFIYFLIFLPYLQVEIFTGCCFCPLDVYVHLHILFIIQDWYVDVLFSNSKTNQLCQLAYDLFVSFNALFFLCLIYFHSKARQLILATHQSLFAEWLPDMHLLFLITFWILSALVAMPKLHLKR